MKITYLLLSLIIFSSCSTNPLKQKLQFRGPSSIDNGIITIDPKELPDELPDGSFYEFLKEARQRGHEKVVFEPERPLFKKVSLTEDTSTSGDFFILMGTNFTDTDERIRKADYNDLYQTVKRMSWLKFRVVVNLVASVTDLKSALSNKRPTIIVWTSHGNKSYFYDFNQVQIPHDIFKDASPSVYQFILASCEGFHSLQNSYKENMPKNFRWWAWKDLTYHPGTFTSDFIGKDWHPFINYPGDFTSRGLSCVKDGDSFVIQEQGQKLENSKGNSNVENCAYIVANSTEKQVCLINGAKWGIYSRKLGKFMPGLDFDTHYDCHSRITNVYNNKTCRRFEDDNLFHYVDVDTHERSEKSFSGMNGCFDYIQKTTEI